MTMLADYLVSLLCKATQWQFKMKQTIDYGWGVFIFVSEYSNISLW